MGFLRLGLHDLCNGDYRHEKTVLLTTRMQMWEAAVGYFQQVRKDLQGQNEKLDNMK
jgi:hypothetical protein